MIALCQEFASTHTNAQSIPLRQLPMLARICIPNLQLMKGKLRDTKQFVQLYNGCETGKAKWRVETITWPNQVNKNKDLRGKCIPSLHHA